MASYVLELLIILIVLLLLTVVGLLHDNLSTRYIRSIYSTVSNIEHLHKYKIFQKFKYCRIVIAFHENICFNEEYNYLKLINYLLNNLLIAPNVRSSSLQSI